MIWIVIGIVAGQLIVHQHLNPEACEYDARVGRSLGAVAECYSLDAEKYDELVKI
jgi:hypothetical protein